MVHRICPLKRCVSFQSHLWIWTWVIIQKPSNFGKICFDLCDLELWHLTMTFCIDITCVNGNPENFMMTRWHWNYKMPVRWILSYVWVRLSIFSQLSIKHYIGLCVSVHPSPLWWLRWYTLCLIIIIKSEVWTIIHWLGLGHETMVCAVCLSIFSWGEHCQKGVTDGQTDGHIIGARARSLSCSVTKSCTALRIW